MAFTHLLIFASFLALTFSQECDISGQCYNATLIGISIAENSKECLKNCQEAVDISGCNWYSYNQQTQICEFLQDCDQIDSVGCPTCISGEVTCPIYQCDLQGLCMVSFENI